MADVVGTKTDQERIIEKIAALIAKAEASEFEAEKDAFWSKTLELLDKYALTLADIRKTEPQKIQIVHRAVRMAALSTTPGDWYKLFVGSIALYTGTKGIHWAKEKDIHAIYIGSEQQVELALFMFMNLVTRLLDKCDKATRVAFQTGRIKRKKGDGLPARQMWRRAFMVAACDELGKRLERIVHERSEALRGTEIVVFSKSELDAYTAEVFGKLKQPKAVTVKNKYYDAIKEGEKAGREIDIQQGLPASNQSRRELE